MKTIDIGVVGVGYLGEFHAEKFTRIPGARLVGVADCDEPRGRLIADKFGVEFFPGHKDLLDRVEAVSIAVPTAEHHTVARDFLEAGADVFIEKPITRSLEEADELTELAEKKGPHSSGRAPRAIQSGDNSPAGRHRQAHVHRIPPARIFQGARR